MISGPVITHDPRPKRTRSNSDSSPFSPDPRKRPKVSPDLMLRGDLNLQLLDGPDSWLDVDPHTIGNEDWGLGYGDGNYQGGSGWGKTDEEGGAFQTEDSDQGFNDAYFNGHGFSVDNGEYHYDAGDFDDKVVGVGVVYQGAGHGVESDGGVVGGAAAYHGAGYGGGGDGGVVDGGAVYHGVGYGGEGDGGVAGGAAVYHRAGYGGEGDGGVAGGAAVYLGAGYSGEGDGGVADGGAVYHEAGDGGEGDGGGISDEVIAGVGDGGAVGSTAIDDEPGPKTPTPPSKASLPLDPTQVALYIVLLYRRRLVEPDSDLSTLIVGFREMKVLAGELYSLSMEELVLDSRVSTEILFHMIGARL